MSDKFQTTGNIKGDDSIDLTEYADSNVFAKIIRGELPSKKVYENDNVLAFHTIQPLADVHILVIPKGKYLHYGHFIQNASLEEKLAFFNSMDEIARQFNLSSYRLLTNCGADVGQQVPHFHVHLLYGNIIKH